MNSNGEAVIVGNEVFVVAEQLATRAVIRARAIEAWVSLALESPDPEAWADALIASALDRLNELRETLQSSRGHRSRILDMRRAILAGIFNNRQPRPVDDPHLVAIASRRPLGRAK